MNNLTSYNSIDCWSFIQPLITILLCLLSVFIVLGNTVVVSAIWHEPQLHSVTNYLIASLAAADCLVGLVVMPFCILSENILGSWPFGAIWCDLWHSFDVLASTASIMNLCAISLDRYLAITDPISYPARLTPKRVALLIVSLWTCSSLISFPAIIWWRSVGQGPLQKIEAINLSSSLNQQQEQQLKYSQTTSSTMISTLYPLDYISSSFQEQINSTFDNAISIKHAEQESTYKCVFTDNTYYLLFSSFISFYGPLCIMLYAYYRIYKAAVKQTRFLKYGSKSVNLHDRSSRDKDGSSNMERQQLVLRAHRGGGGNVNKSNNTNINTNSVKITITKQSSSNSTCNNNLKILPQENEQQFELLSTSVTNEKGQMIFYDSGKLLQSIVDLSAIDYIDNPEKTTSNIKESQCPPTEPEVTISETTTEQVQLPDNHHNRSNTARHHHSRSVGRKLSRLAKEKKAAKTLGIVVGVFILCWLPFFVVNIIVALCGSHCIYKIEIFHGVVTWLGWLNSAMNPVIYACWSRDFRRAFRKVLCAWISW